MHEAPHVVFLSPNSPNSDLDQRDVMDTQKSFWGRDSQGVRNDTNMTVRWLDFSGGCALSWKVETPTGGRDASIMSQFAFASPTEGRRRALGEEGHRNAGKGASVPRVQKREGSRVRIQHLDGVERGAEDAFPGFEARELILYKDEYTRDGDTEASMMTGR